MDTWSHYGLIVHDAVFIMFMVAWVLLAFDAVQQWQKVKRKREREKQWETS